MYGKRETNQEGIMGHPTIYPTGVTVYNPEKCWNGFTIFQALEVGAVLMNMNGRENKVWKGVHGFPNQAFPRRLPHDLARLP